MYHFFKRIFDLVLSLIGLVFLIPLYIIIRLLYIFTGDFHRIIFIQTRIGKNGKPFKFLKFRTMVINADEELKKLLKEPKYNNEYTKNHKFSHDPRITKAGRIIRRLSLDEFPQFINIFIGQMSMVGNRPYLLDEKKNIREKDFRIIVKTKPGLTGFWQAHLRSRGTFEDRIRMDLFYSENASLFLDTKIFFYTFTTIFKKSSAK